MSVKRRGLFLAGAFWLFLSGPLQAGGGEPYSPFYVDKGFNILPQSLTARRNYKRSSFYAASFSSEEYGEFAQREVFNLQAWSEFLKRSPDDSRKIVYQGEFPADLDPDTRNYLSAAREQEPLVTQPKKKPDLQRYNQTIKTLQSALTQTKSGFLRQRYVYLILRLAHYSKQYDKVETLYAQYEQQRQKPNTEISLWIDGLRAGALRRKGQRAEAAYQFAHIFLESQTRQLEAQTNFVIKTDAEWQALLALCQDGDEKALMHYMRSLKSKANSLAELKTIYQLAPDSPWVDEALVRELEFVQFSKGVKTPPRGQWWQAVRTVEPDRLIADSLVHSKPKLAEQVKQRRTAYLKELNGIVATIREEKKRSDLFLSDFAALYLKLLQQEAIDVAEVQAFQASYADKSRATATKALEYFVYLENLEAIDPAAETQISAYLEQLLPLYRVVGEYGADRADFNQNILDYTYIKLEPLYLKQKAGWQPAKTYAAKNRGEVILDNMLVVELRDFKKLLEEDNGQHSLLLQNMLKEMRLTAKGYSLDEAVARKYLAADLPEKALAALEKVSPQPTDKVWRTVYNPFNTALSGNNRKGGAASKTLKEVTETLLTLSQQVKENPKDAQAYYLLGTLHYNMSWFGNSPMLLRYYRQTTGWADGEIDLKKAKDYYRLALEHSGDRNMKAKALYALAKIERVELYTLGVDENSAGYGRVHKPGFGPNAYQKYLAQQKKRGFAGEYLGKLKGYGDTAYFKQVISQCADYRYFYSE